MSVPPSKSQTITIIDEAECYSLPNYLANHETMAESPHGSVSLSFDADLHNFLQDFPQSEDTQGLPLSGSEMIQMSQNLAAPGQAQSSFIRWTSLLKDSFLETPTPSPSERLRLAACTGLDRSDVSAWFDIIRSLMIDVGANSIPLPNPTQASMSELFPNLNPPQSSARPSRPLRTSATSSQRRSSPGYSGPSKRRQIEDVPQDKGPLRAFDNQQKVSQRRPSKSSLEGPYRCPTTACKFSTMIFDQWHTHQSRKHFPSEIFVCGIVSGTKPCNKGADNPCKRKDNFVTHLKESHGFETGHALDQEVSKRTVKVTGLFHDKCGFCSDTLDTREASIEHIGDHIKSGDKITDWTHRCTSLEHTLQHHVHFENSSNNPETADNSSENFDDLIQKGDYDHGDSANLFDREPSSDTREDSGPTYACASPARGSAGDSLYACAVPSGGSAGYTRENPSACATPSRSFTRHSSARLNEPAVPPASSTTTCVPPATFTRSLPDRTVMSSLNTSLCPSGSDYKYHKSKSSGLCEPWRTSSVSRDWTMGTKLRDRYEGEMVRESSRAHSSHCQGPPKSSRRKNRDERSKRSNAVTTNDGHNRSMGPPFGVGGCRIP